MITLAKQSVKDLCDEIYTKKPQQIVIDLVQEGAEELLNEEYPSRDAVSAAAYEADILLEAFNPAFGWDVDFLKRLSKGLSDWAADIEQTNILLNIPRES